MKDSYIDLISPGFKEKFALCYLNEDVPIMRGDMVSMSEKERHRYHLVQMVLRGKTTLNGAEGREFYPKARCLCSCFTKNAPVIFRTRQ